MLGTLVTLIFVLFLQNVPFFVRTELAAYDWNFQRRGVEPGPNNIVISAIDDTSVQNLNNGVYPLRRRSDANALNFLCHSGARVIAMDLLFTAPSTDPAGDRAFARAIQGCHNVVLGDFLQAGGASNFVHSFTQVVPPIEMFARGAAGVGLTNVPQDADGEVRAVNLQLPGQNHKLLPTFPVEVASVVLHRSVSDIIRGLGDPTLINYRGPEQEGAHSFKVTEFQSIATLNKSLQDSPRVYRGKIVLIVPAATVTKDLFNTPFGEMFGGFLQANALNTLLHRNPIVPVGNIVNNSILFILGIIMTVIAARFGIWHSAAGFLGIAVGYPIVSVFAFSNFGLWFNLVTPEAATVVVFGIIMTLRFATEERQRRRTSRIFGQYVKPEVVDILVNSPDPEKTLTGEKADLSMLFVDIRGFTSMSEGMVPEDVIKVLDIYLEQLTESVQMYDGTVNKYVGDEIVAMWNTPFEQPDHPMLAVKSALEMVRRMEGINQELSSQGLPMIRYGIGVNTGPTIVGQMGSSFRKQFDVIGDAVNTGARLCSAAAGGEIIIGQTTWEIIGHELDVEETEPLRLKGKSQPLRTFRVLDLRSEGARPVPDPAAV
jgi:adenylate cyclase